MHEGSVITGKYRLVRPLGEGAMGIVWAAVNLATERRVALKLIGHAHAGNEEGRARLLREARACGRITHKNVVEILDAGETEDGDPYLVMPMLVGETLAARIEREGRLAPPIATHIALDVARGLAAAHAAGIVHRDLKPGNVFVVREADTGEDTIKLLDFGVSKILASQDAAATATGSALGSPAYMAPEQVRGVRDIDHRADLWAFGVVLFEMLTGARPFVGDSIYTVAGEILGGRIPDVREQLPSADPRLAAIITSCLERDVSRRVQSAGDIVQSLRAILGVPLAATSAPVLPADTGTVLIQRPSPGITSTTPMLGNVLVPSRSSLPIVVAVGAVALMGLAMGVTIFFTQHRTSNEPTSASTFTLDPPATTTAPATSIRTDVVPTTTLATATASAAASLSATSTISQPTRPVETHGAQTPPAIKSAAPKPKTRLPTDPG